MTLFDGGEQSASRVGGWTVSFRVVLGAAVGLTLWLLQQFGSQIISNQDKFQKTQERQISLISTLAQQTKDNSQLSARNSDRLDDHEHRITILEVRVGSVH